jgi:hypothetical protein
MTEIQWRKSSFSNGSSACVEVAPTWRKSSFSQGNGNCVETMPEPSGFAIRDSKLGDASPVLHFTAAEFAAWVKGCAAGEFNLE